MRNNRTRNKNKWRKMTRKGKHTESKRLKRIPKRKLERKLTGGKLETNERQPINATKENKNMEG